MHRMANRPRSKITGEARQKKAAEKAEAEAVRLSDIAAKNLKAAGVRAMNFKTENTFILDIQAKAAKYLLSQKQIDALKNACKRERDRKKRGEVRNPPARRPTGNHG